MVSHFSLISLEYPRKFWACYLLGHTDLESAGKSNQFVNRYSIFFFEIYWQVFFSAFYLGKFSFRRKRWITFYSFHFYLRIFHSQLQRLFSLFDLSCRTKFRGFRKEKVFSFETGSMNAFAILFRFFVTFKALATFFI